MSRHLARCSTAWPAGGKICAVKKRLPQEHLLVRTARAMDLESKFEQWFASLSETQRAEALTSPSELPSWMVASLQRAGIPPVAVLHSDRSLLDRGYVMPTQVRELLEQRSSRF
jgi:hypothetical protein